MNRDWFEGWRGQYKRMIRWQARANEALKNSDGDTIYDFIYAFFQSCYHLRDWLASDGVATSEDLKNVFSSCAELQLCRDICNASKHLQYDRPTIEPVPMICREWNSFDNKYMDYSLYTDKRIPITDLMAQCVKTWNDFLKDKGLNA